MSAKTDPWALARWAHAQASERELTPLQAHVLQATATYANTRTLEARVSRRAIAAVVRRHPSTVSRANAELERLGLLERRRRARGRSNITRLVVTDHAEALLPAPSTRPQDVAPTRPLTSSRGDVQTSPYGDTGLQGWTTKGTDPPTPQRGAEIEVEASAVEQRALDRVAAGSRRRRDLQMVERVEAHRFARLTAGGPSPTARAAWSAVRERVAAALPESTYGLWFAPLRLVGECDGALVLSAPPHVRDWVERRYLALLADAAAPRSVVITARRKEEKERKTRDDDPSTSAPPERGKREEDAR